MLEIRIVISYYYAKNSIMLHDLDITITECRQSHMIILTNIVEKYEREKEEIEERWWHQWLKKCMG